MHNKMIYLACPYTVSGTATDQEREINYINCATAANKLQQKGYLVYAPILQSQPIEKYCGAEANWEAWQAYDYAWIDKCDEVHVLCGKGWRESIGVLDEIDYALAKNKPVFMYSPRLSELEE